MEHQRRVLRAAGRENVDDVGFIGAVVNDIEANVGIDAGRVYATGISNGGMMSYALACNTGHSRPSDPTPRHNSTVARHRIPPRSCTSMGPPTD